MADCPGLMTFASRLVNFVLNMPNSQVKFFGVIQITKGLSSILLVNNFFLEGGGGGGGLVQMPFGFVC